MMIKPFQKRWSLAAPGNNEIAILWDSTRGDHYPAPSAVLSGSSYLIPGPLHGKFPRGIIEGFVGVTGQPVTIKAYKRTAYNNAAADWELDESFVGSGTGTVVVAAGDTQPFEWKFATEHLLRVDMGATAPTLFWAEFTWTPTQDYGA